MSPPDPAAAACQGRAVGEWSRRTGRQNSRGGGIASWFYAKNRLLDGETFYVNATDD